MPNDLQAANVRKVKCFGQVVYEEFYKGFPLFEWEKIPTDIQIKWDSAARAAVDWYVALVKEQQAMQNSEPARYVPVTENCARGFDPEIEAKQALARDTAELDEGDATDICKFPRGYRPAPKESWFSALFGRKRRA